MIIDDIGVDAAAYYVGMRRPFRIGVSLWATRSPEESSTGDLSLSWAHRWKRDFEEIAYVVVAEGTPVAWILCDGTPVLPDCKLSPSAHRFQMMIAPAL
ncbi:hypothetical protein GCM10010178_42840 [Lentzea flava]|uniref:DDE superfamily endonuclease n=1 Tax=Lentzea flava TaxID=103732 RepID=A0ABQ2UN47_9PSEU|nr:hypothetical protein GCM10010178_42840 [Lentzea flava]